VKLWTHVVRGVTEFLAAEQGTVGVSDFQAVPPTMVIETTIDIVGARARASMLTSLLPAKRGWLKGAKPMALTTQLNPRLAGERLKNRVRRLYRLPPTGEMVITLPRILQKMIS
jgi:hypothetical protein